MNYLVNQRRKQLGRALNRLQLTNRDFTLFSNDCWGAEVYKHFDLPYNTPFVGLMLYAPCFVRLLSNPRHYLAQPLVFQATSRYPEINTIQAGWEHQFPIATLGAAKDDIGVEIEFLHYHSEEEAREKWTRRVSRINWDNIFVKLDGSKDCATPELVRRFDQEVGYPHLTLLREPLAGIQSAVVVPHYTPNGMLLFERSLPEYDLVGWLNKGQWQPSLTRRLTNRLLFPPIS